MTEAKKYTAKTGLDFYRLNHKKRVEAGERLPEELTEQEVGDLEAMDLIEETDFLTLNGVKRPEVLTMGVEETE